MERPEALPKLYVHKLYPHLANTLKSIDWAAMSIWERLYYSTTRFYGS